MSQVRDGGKAERSEQGDTSDPQFVGEIRRIIFVPGEGKSGADAGELGKPPNESAHYQPNEHAQPAALRCSNHHER